MIDIYNAFVNKENIANTDGCTDEEGFFICSNCNTRKQTEIKNPFNNKLEKVPIMCQCQTEKYDHEEADRFRYKFEMKVSRLRRDGLTDPEYLNWVFNNDDERYADISRACKKYVDEWNEMKSENVGLLFFGSVGTGKTFYACCIANALLEKCVPVLVTSFPRILNRIQSVGWNEDRYEFINRLQH